MLHLKEHANKQHANGDLAQIEIQIESLRQSLQSLASTLLSTLEPLRIGASLLSAAAAAAALAAGAGGAGYMSLSRVSSSCVCALHAATQRRDMPRFDSPCGALTPCVRRRTHAEGGGMVRAGMVRAVCTVSATLLISMAAAVGTVIALGVALDAVPLKAVHCHPHLEASLMSL
tara:strand:- start:580 stop:1101 length:522 start_codon:yes stop_codon:yes gene_type:complete